jgi:DtxR family Mn-dependent transcriptional regulator
MDTEATENYLRSIYGLQESHTPVTTGALAARLAVRPPSVTNILKRLAALKLVVYTPYHTVVLTAAGEAVARRLLRSHRPIGCYLSVVFKLPFDQVHEAADKWEHALPPKSCNDVTFVVDLRELKRGQPAKAPFFVLHGLRTREGVICRASPAPGCAP